MLKKLPEDTLVDIIRSGVSFQDFLSFIESDERLQALANKSEFMARIGRVYDLPVVPSLLRSYERMYNASRPDRLDDAIRYNDYYYVGNHIDDHTIGYLRAMIDRNVDEDMSFDMAKAIVDACNRLETPDKPSKRITRIYELLWHRLTDSDSLLYLLRNGNRDLQMDIDYPKTIIPSITANNELINDLEDYDWEGPLGVEVLETVLSIREDFQLDDEKVDTISDSMPHVLIKDYSRVVNFLHEYGDWWMYSGEYLVSEYATENIIYLDSQNKNIIPWLIDNVDEEDLKKLGSILEANPDLDPDHEYRDKLD